MPSVTSSDVLEGAPLFTIGQVERRGLIQQRHAESRRRVPDANELVGMVEWERLEQHTLDDAEDRRVGADAQREGEHRDEREQRRASEPPQHTSDPRWQEFHRSLSLDGCEGARVQHLTSAETV